MAVPSDERLLDAPMLPVRCTACAATVLARKSSWQQTSVQWTAEASAACIERATAATAESSAPAGGSHPRPFETCGALRTSIRAAAVAGGLPVRDTDA